MLTRKISIAHAAAMDAKEAVFRAQDRLSEAWQEHASRETRGDRDLPRDRTLVQIERRLAKVRAELETLDRDYYTAAMRQGMEDFDAHV